MDTDVTMSISSLNTLATGVTITLRIDKLYIPVLPGTPYNQIGDIEIEIPEEFTGVPMCLCKNNNFNKKNKILIIYC